MNSLNSLRALVVALPLFLSSARAAVLNAAFNSTSDMPITTGNLTTDAQIAALARQEKAVLHSNDTDFQRFPGTHWHNPLTGMSGTT